LGVGNRVHFLGYRADTPRLMRAVDLVVHCSTAPEPFGRVIVEALFAGTPVLAADGGASREILGTETTWLVPPGNVPVLAAAIARTLATDAGTMAFQVAAMRSRVEEEFTLSRMMAGIDRLIAEA
jgi:glycosyltransferase involved in cell wall biosynthesis